MAKKFFYKYSVIVLVAKIFFYKYFITKTVTLSRFYLVNVLKKWMTLVQLSLSSTNYLNWWKSFQTMTTKHVVFLKTIVIVLKHDTPVMDETTYQIEKGKRLKLTRVEWKWIHLQKFMCL